MICQETNRIAFLTCVGVLAVLAVSKAGADVKWPLDPQSTTHRLWSSYGHFSAGTHDHFHAGIDLPVVKLPGNNMPWVWAVEDGTVEWVRDDGDYQDFIEVSRGGDEHKGWGYVHVAIGINPAQGLKWARHDTFKWPARLGTVYDATSVMDHLHFEALNDSNGGWGAGPANGHPEDLEGDPLDYLSPSALSQVAIVKDNTIQDVEHFFYRDGNQEGALGATYFEDAFDDRIVVSGNVDIIVRARETFGQHQGIDYDLGVKRIELEVSGYNAIQETFEDFSGLFLTAEVPVGRNAWTEFEDEERTYTIYEADDTAESRDHSAGASGTSSNTGKFYYIVTNKNENDDNEFVDAVCFWDTDAKKNDPWNECTAPLGQEDPAYDADNNAEANFPDGHYTVTITAFGRSSFDLEHDEIYVNNYDELVSTTYSPGLPVEVAGNGFDRNANYTIYLTKRTEWPAGSSIPQGDVVRQVAVTTDEYGNIGAIEIWDDYRPNGKPDVGYDIVIDYDGDGKYYPPLAGHTIDALAHISLDLCDDGSACTQYEYWQDGNCIGGIPVDCSGAHGECIDASCDPGGVEGNCDIGPPMPDGWPCSAVDICNVGLGCYMGTCDIVPDDNAQCDDGNVCTDPDFCWGGLCIGEWIGGACDDGNPCSFGTTCQAGFCDGQWTDCSAAGDQCNIASCDLNGAGGNCDSLTPFNQGVACDDGDPCTLGETCQDGTCAGGLPPDCSVHGDQCNTASCYVLGSEGNCDTLTPLAEGWPCDDADECTSDDYCDDGVCTGVWIPDCGDGAGEVPDGYRVAGTPLTVDKAVSEDLLLSWGESCLFNDSDYAIYEGLLGDFAGHLSLTCATGGATTHTITPTVGSTYYLIVPLSENGEGSYGTESDGTLRPQSPGPCMAQSVVPCQ